MSQHLPSSLRAAFARKTWPQGRLSGQKFPVVWEHTKCDLELAPTMDEIGADNSSIATLSTLRRIDPQTRASWHLCEGSPTGSLNRTPWLDLSRATVIGGGADYGDDLFLVLDLRTSLEDPAVLFNLITTPNGSRAEWIVAAPSLTEFLRQAGR